MIGDKAIITISNYLGGYYYFTSDEAKIDNGDIHLVEGKHSRTRSLPSQLDIKEGLLKMILFTNLKEVTVENKSYKPMPILKLTVENGFDANNVSSSEGELLRCLNKEAKENGFKVIIE